MKYLNSKFSVGLGTSSEENGDAYRRNYEITFGKKESKSEEEETLSNEDRRKE